jgi:NAD(P) transhydrogenase subunit alpha
LRRSGAFHPEDYHVTSTSIIQLFVFMLAGFVGFQTISRIPPLLHTPLMAATNAISGISLVASIVLAGAGQGVLGTALGAVAVACAMANVVGGFLITDRMLAMFRPAPAPSKHPLKGRADQ